MQMQAVTTSVSECLLFNVENFMPFSLINHFKRSALNIPTRTFSTRPPFNSSIAFLSIKMLRQGGREGGGGHRGDLTVRRRATT